MSDLTHANKWLVYLLLFALVFIISWAVSSLFARANKVKEKEKKLPRLGFFGSLILILSLGLLVLTISVSRIYTVFTAHELVATVECHPAYGFGRGAFELVLSQVKKGELTEEQSFILKGEKWSIGGDILEWRSTMSILGMKSMYRLTRVQSHYASAEEEMMSPIAAFPLVEDEANDFWRTLADIAVKTPMIKSVHQNFVSTFPYYGDTFEIYATTSGFTMERFKDKR